jgi:hypothetical protein
MPFMGWEVVMDEELRLVIWGAVAGLVSALALEFAKQRLERYRAALEEARDRQKKRSERIEEFYLGGEATERPDQAPEPAWLRQVTVARRYPLARLGLRSDEDYGTDIHLVTRERGVNTITLGKSVRQLKTRLFLTLPSALPGGTARFKRPSKQKGGKFLLGPAHILGRSSKCDIQILDPGVSLLHAFIRFEDDRYVLYDLGSTVGTYVNGEPVGIAGISLFGGEMIQMGNTLFEFGRAIKEGEQEPDILY